MFTLIGYDQNYLVFNRFYFANQLFRMPSKAWNKRNYLKDRYRTQVSSESGSDKIIPNCPLQGKKEITGIHGTLRRTRTYPE